MEMENILITGGSGTLGHALAKRLYNECDITIYSRSEYLQAQMRKEYPDCRYVLGDVRDYGRLHAAIAGHDTVIHAAAMKRLPECEAQPSECWQTNVMGSENVALACISNGVNRCVGISTDKACQAVTMYGASKLAMERVFQAQPKNATVFTLVRYGNVLESRGSVIPFWRSQVAAGRPVTITDYRMSRFWMTPREAVDLVMATLELEFISGGEVLVPKMKGLPVVKMAEYAIGADHDMTEIGLRSMERLHEWLVGPDELVLEEAPDSFLLSSTHGESGHNWRSDTAPELSEAEFMAMLGEVEA